MKLGWIGVAAFSILAGGVAGQAPASRTALGPAVKIGHGVARTFVRTGAQGEPVAYGVQFSAGMLEGLPAKDSSDASLNWNYTLGFPRGANIGFDHLMINWHPMGHAPQGVYTVPHFDFHFYQISLQKQLAIRFPHDQAPDWTGVVFPKASLVAPGFFFPPAGQVSKMGYHSISMGAPEMHGQPFTNTFIYGYNDGRLEFLEPMVAMSYLRTRPNSVMELATPPEYSYPGWFPTRYRISYDAGTQMYALTFEALQQWKTRSGAASDAR